LPWIQSSPQFDHICRSKTQEGDILKPNPARSSINPVSLHTTIYISFEMPSGIVLVPGMTCVASVVYAPLVKRLKKLGIEKVHAKELPSVDPQESLQPNPLEADIAAIRASSPGSSKIEA